MTEQLMSNGICWIIILLALVCYQQLFYEYLNDYLAPNDVGFEAETKQQYSTSLIAALPLLGLLGTIIGLLDCFSRMADEGVNAELVSGGIADALLTTQLGLVCAIPAWLLQAFVRRPTKQQAITFNYKAG